MIHSSFWNVRGITYSALFGALLVAFSFVNIPLGFTPVPISLANFAIMLAGALLGARYGFLSIGTVIVLSALGLPLIHGTGGASLLLGTSGGFVWAYPFAALFIGFFFSRIKGNSWGSFILMFLVLEVFGSLLLYVSGVPWLSHAAQIPFQKALALGCYPFLPGDLAKALVAAFVVRQLRVYYPKGVLSSRNSSVVTLEQ
ncbi:MAG: BioY protein [Paenibacillus sp.]|jgi:biotin transport system substrate-specific component|nr:BioY protein [Paenibacillus sp.]